MCKTIVFVSDTHCGSVFGLTPPAYYEADDARREMQEEAWKAYVSIVNKWRNPDVLVCNGDLIEGTQKLQGGAELTNPDRNIQTEMGVKCLSMFHAKKVLMTYGSKYHVGEGAEDFEYNAAHDLGAEIGGRLYFELEGVVFDCRHKVGLSGIPHGRATSLIKEMMWNLIKESTEAGPKVRVVVRSHVHYHIWIEQGDRVMFTTPALQLSRGRYGSRECVGETHWGAVRLTLSKGKIVNKEVDLCALASNRPKLMRIK